MDDNTRDELLVRVDERVKLLTDWTKQHDLKHMRWSIGLGVGVLLLVLNLLV